LRWGERSSLKEELERGRGLKAEEVYHAARAGDEMALELFHMVGRNLGIAIANVVHLVGVRNALIGGGLANAWEVFIGPLQEELKQRLTLIPASEVKVVRAQLGDDAGAIGAAYLAASRTGLISAHRVP
jgi:glucokinase